MLEPDPQGILPFGEARASALERAALLQLVDAADIGTLRPGAGARLDKRLLLCSLLAMPLSQRRPGGRYELRRSPRELVRELWPVRQGKPSSCKPSRPGQRLLDGLLAMSHAKVRLPSRSRHGWWIPAVARALPDPHKMNSEAVIQVELPAECDRGPIVQRLQPIREGVRSDPAFDLWLSLAYCWDSAKARNGGYRIYATRPKAKRNARGYLLDSTGSVILLQNGQPATDWQPPRRFSRARSATRKRIAYRSLIQSRSGRWRTAGRAAARTKASAPGN